MALSDFVALLQNKIDTIDRKLVDVQATMDFLNAQRAEAVNDLAAINDTIVTQAAAAVKPGLGV